MAINATRLQQAAATSATAHPALSQDAGTRRVSQPSVPGPAAEAPRKASGYGLPCSKCRLYYPADLDACPTCHHKERVSPVVPKVRPKIAHAVPEPSPDSTLVEKEREEFLRQFKSQLMEAQAEAVKGSGQVCAVEGHRSGESDAAEVCRACYERLQERLDVFEAALHLDLKEATQIIYDAVWADASDPGKTYQNAASALLAELRKRAGMSTVHSPFQPLSH